MSWRQDGEPVGRRLGGEAWPVQTTPPTNLLHGGDAQQLIIISGRCLCSEGQRHYMLTRGGALLNKEGFREVEGKGDIVLVLF